MPSRVPHTLRLSAALAVFVTAFFTFSYATSFTVWAREKKPQAKISATKTSLKSTATTGTAKSKSAGAAGAKAKSANPRPAKKTTERLSKPPSKAQGSIALFAVSQNRAGAFLDPIVVIEKGRYLNPPSGGASNTRLKKFADRYYRPGQKYRLLFGGGEAGSVTVKQWNHKKECSRTEASAALNTEAKISGRVMGLATNSEAIGRRTRSRRAPGEKERNTVEAMARRIYRQKGIPVAQLSAVRTINMTATDLNGDRRAEVIGTFLLKGARAAHILFVIAEPKGESFKTAFTQYGQITAKDVGSTEQFDELGGTALAEILVDQIDLDRDGASEVIIADLTREGIAYKIFQKQKSGWRKAYEFYNYRCAN